MEEFTLKAEPRTDFGSRAARRLRSAGRLPANIYGHGEQNLSVSLDVREFRKFFAAGHRMVTIQVDGRAEHGFLKEVQYDTLGTEPVHVDFSRIRLDETIEVEVPVVIVGVAKGTSSGGVLEQPLHELTVEGPANRVPESFEVRVDELKIGEAIRVRDLATPADCRFLDDPDQVVVAVAAQREEAPVEGAAAPAPSEPEVITRRKEEEESD